MIGDCEVHLDSTAARNVRLRDTATSTQGHVASVLTVSYDEVMRASASLSMSSRRLTEVVQGNFDSLTRGCMDVDGTAYRGDISVKFEVARNQPDVAGRLNANGTATTFSSGVHYCKTYIAIVTSCN